MIAHTFRPEGGSPVRRVSVLGALSVMVASAMLPTLAWAQTQANPARADKNVAAAQVTNVPKTTSNSPADYLGAEVCKTCHEDIYSAWEKSPHWKTTLDTKGGPSHQGCESCHGPGSAHVAGGGDVTNILSSRITRRRRLTLAA